ncbi:P1 family peptidase [Sporosarcina oncorhynchi]|uniref:P1 family peptidase n=1 Tax=Sporosarcina oncorhynchi TaxID=3056444 RepID=A0ABZ0L6E0_9BACL|nr:P1 family peptidase [Sporosarcina sp. T2O-4]WOV88134.1 P1 family peptidase [Sporosarcina sp. T2O-4]
MLNGNITDVPGIQVGNVENLEALTGCTVILAEEGAVCGVDVRGSAPGTRETDLLDPVNLVDQVHAICLSGGSAYGLESATGVMHFLEEKGIGLDVGVARVPIVPGAVLFDLAIGDPKVRPDKEMGYTAASRAKKGEFPFGNIGAGCGATVGKMAGNDSCMKGGLGSASVSLDNGLVVGALVAVNAVGDIRDPDNREILAGMIDPKTGEFRDSLLYLEKGMDNNSMAGANTTIGLVAVNAELTKAEAKKIAQITQNALARTTYPAHTMLDGDTIFTLATKGKKYNVDLIGNIAAKVMEEAIIAAIKEADAVAGIPSYKSMNAQS